MPDRSLKVDSVLADASQFIGEQEALLEKQSQLIEQQRKTIHDLFQLCAEQGALLDKIVGSKK